MGTRVSLGGTDWIFKGYVGLDWLARRAYMPDTKDTRGWKEAKVPGSVHHDLWKNGEIADPYFEQNSRLSEWVAARTWVYKKKFRVEALGQEQRAYLHFAGIDYQARLFLNGHDIGAHEGMFVPFRCDVTDYLDVGGDNTLSVVLMRAPDEEPQVGKTSLVRTHKSRMTYWWDFCPRMIHMGIWDEVYLELQNSVYIDDVWVRPSYEPDEDLARIDLCTVVAAHDEAELTLHALVKFAGEVVWQEIKVFRPSQHAVVKQSAVLERPHLWWPNGYGESALYDVEISVSRNGIVSDSYTVATGIRSVELVANDDASPDAQPYTFVVNGVKMYINGWNWVPMDVMYGVNRPEKLNHLLQLAKSANVNLLRVWGGGLIEKESFYNWCDQHGIMVWQEFIQSSSGVENKPSEDKAFIDMMVKQAEQIVTGRRNHPSLVVWCGGNELQALDGTPLTNEEPVLGALQEVVRRLDPSRHWLATSPTGPVFLNTIQNIEQYPDGLHDVHGPWEHQGLTEHCTLYNRGTSLFHSEFGVEGIANERTLNRTISPEHQWPANRDNPIWDHRGSWWINEPLVQASFGGIHCLRDLVYASQFLQAEGLRYAIESNRRRAWRNSGSIPWQLNESYPNAYCTAAVDYYGIPKPAYYAVARAYQPIHVTAKFDTQAWAGKDAFDASLWVSNARGEVLLDCQLHVRMIGITGHVYDAWTRAVSLDGTVNQQLLDVHSRLDEIREALFVLDMQLEGPSGEVLSTNRYWFTKEETLHGLTALPKVELQVEVVEESGVQAIEIRNAGTAAAMMVRIDDCFRLDDEDRYVRFSDNAFGLLPGEARTLKIDTDSDIEQAELVVEAWNAEKTSISVRPLRKRGTSYVSSCS